MESLFRALVVVSALLSVVLWSVPYFDYMWLSNEQLHILDLSGFGSYFPQSQLIHWGSLFLWLVLSVGLFFYINIARPAFVVCMVLFTVAGLFFGMSVLSPLDVFIGSILTMLDGAIITMMYLTSIAGKFSANT